jgi:epoxyqueuosine reductase
MDLKAQILDEADRLGFAAAGVAPAEPAQGLDIYREWLASGRAAGMDYLSKHLELRADPRVLAPGARSVIMVAARYPVNGRPGEGFSTYARGLDYHEIIRGKLRALAAFLQARAPLGVARVCVDSAPFPEREWAVRAGIGWQGRQGQVVNARFGCCLLLGGLLVDVELEPSAPVADQCGLCRLCVRSCPTGALCEDGRVDARRCLSYLTIEHKGEIPPALRSGLGQALFGCDFCTAVCPWNRFGADRVLPELAERTLPDADACQRLTPEEFHRRFGGTAVERTGLERLRRNAAIAIANRLARGG